MPSVPVPHHKAPLPRPYTIRLPEARLIRLGAVGAALDTYRELWDRYGENPGAATNRQRMLADLSSLTDGELGAQIDTLTQVPDMGVNATAAWVRASPTPNLAAALAMEQEMGRDQPRPSLVDKLRGYHIG